MGPPVILWGMGMRPLMILSVWGPGIGLSAAVVGGAGPATVMPTVAVVWRQNTTCTSSLVQISSQWPTSAAVVPTIIITMPVSVSVSVSVSVFLHNNTNHDTHTHQSAINSLAHSGSRRILRTTCPLHHYTSTIEVSAMFSPQCILQEKTPILYTHL